jgi:uncharacterized RDD family membrane protein YckC
MPNGEPSMEITDPHAPEVPERAGFWIRFLAAFLDAIPLSIIAAIARDAEVQWLAVVVAFGYFTACEGSEAGRTPGKALVKIRVVDKRTRGSLGYGRAFVRHAGRWVSAVALIIGYLWMLWDKEKQTWHDKLSDSLVVRER